MPTSAIAATGPTLKAGAVRIQTSVLTQLEKRTLIWLATRMPTATAAR